ncbi:MAG TPA: TlpA disulfide reductase family protein [Candidatus Acidoferrales bacterium]|nr:TlpA disulfide reductase family protein [Candidatus Acidoferrales bacterium]
MWKTRLVSAVVLAGVAALLVAFAKPSYRQGEPSVAGRAAHDFAFTLNGSPTTLSAIPAKIVVLNFWATWCPPCVDETPALERMYTALRPAGVTVLGVSVDQDPAAYQKFLTDNHVSFPNFRDADMEIPRAYGTKMYPETYLITPDHRIARKFIGEQAWDSPGMLGYLRDLAAGKPPRTY